MPLAGARTRTQLAESLGALQVRLSTADVERIEAALPPTAVAGTQYDEHQMRVPRTGVPVHFPGGDHRDLAGWRRALRVAER